MNNELSRELSYAKEKVRYDTQCKRVLRQNDLRTVRGRVYLIWLQRYPKSLFHLAVHECSPQDWKCNLYVFPVQAGNLIIQEEDAAHYAK